MNGVNGPLKALAVATVIVLLGGLLLKGASPAGQSDPIASVENGAPRGWLAVSLLLEKRRPGGAAPVVLKAGDDDAIARLRSGDILLVPTPERSSFSTAEAQQVLDAAGRGARVVVVCDPLKARRNRLSALLTPLGVGCAEVDEALAPTTAEAPPGVPSPVFLRDRGRLRLSDDAGLLPLLVAADGGRDEVVAAVKAFGAGDVVVIGSGTPFANDGLGVDQSAAFLMFLVGNRRVIIDERHHETRGRAAIGNAVLKGPGPLTAALCLLLLVPLSLLAFAPRRGDFAGNDDDTPGDDALARVRALAALMQADRSATTNQKQQKQQKKKEQAP